MREVPWLSSALVLGAAELNPLVLRRVSGVVARFTRGVSGPPDWNPHPGNNHNFFIKGIFYVERILIVALSLI